jgi:hypothetical protein
MIGVATIGTEGHGIAAPGGHDQKKGPGRRGVRLRHGSRPTAAFYVPIARQRRITATPPPFDWGCRGDARQPDGNHIVSLR